MAAAATTYWVAPEDIKELADDLISKHHPEAIDVRIGYLMREKHGTTKGKVVMGNCQKQSAKQKLLNVFDFIITLSADVWAELEPEQREALLLHELKHVGVKPDPDDQDSDVFFLRPHDTEEFRDVIHVYGLWQPDLEELSQAIDDNRLQK
jgi:hypothetical protein